GLGKPVAPFVQQHKKLGFPCCARPQAAPSRPPWPGRLPSRRTRRAVRLAVGGASRRATVLKHNLAVPILGDMPEDSRSGGLERSQLGVAVPVPGLPVYWRG